MKNALCCIVFSFYSSTIWNFMLQESCSVVSTDSHIAESITIEHVSWLLQEVLRELPHCLHRSVYTTARIWHHIWCYTFPIEHIGRKLFASGFSYSHVHNSVTTRTECRMKNVKLITNYCTLTAKVHVYYI